MYQIIGTDVMRNLVKGVGDNFWVKNFDIWYERELRKKSVIFVMEVESIEAISSESLFVEIIEGKIVFKGEIKSICCEAP